MIRLMTKTLGPSVAALCLVGATGFGLAHADETEADDGPVVAPVSKPRTSPLDGQPAVRHRLLLVKQRFELTPAFESSVNAEYRHTVSGGLRAEYHFSDMWSIGAAGFFGTSFNTGLTDSIVGTLQTRAEQQADPDYDPNDPTPNKEEVLEHINSIPLHGAAYISLTPWYGKVAAFETFFLHFDFYFSGGVSFASLANDCCSFMPDDTLTDNNPRNDDPLNSGARFGLYLGGGIHVFLNEWMALDLTVRDYMFNDNPSGLDVVPDGEVTDADGRFLNHLFMGVGVSMFLPGNAERTP